MIKGLKEAAEQLNLGNFGSQDSKAKHQHRDSDMASNLDPDHVPMMYRAQIQGRCSLQFANKRAVKADAPEQKTDLERWNEEWVFADSQDAEGKPYYQFHESDFTSNPSVHYIRISFPWRLFSNCGQDSIFRPVLGKNGIPFIPGSSVKGVFKRACTLQQEKLYCGTQDQPGILRFHGAYPIGDWSGAKRVPFWKQGREIEEIRYRAIDVVHPQQTRQVRGTGSATAIALISLYRPVMIFALSCTDPKFDQWQAVEGLLKQALRRGIGGKTSTGYGLPFLPKNERDYNISIYLKGQGVSPLLRSDEPEFRPNLFKATLRGHVSRLLAGVNEQSIEKKINTLFGSTTYPGSVDIYYDYRPIENWNPTYILGGNLLLSVPASDRELIKWTLKFAYTMGGFGKGWRRVDHKKFYRKDYDKLIGCHWKCEDTGFPNDLSSWVIDVKSWQDLKKFLGDLRNFFIRSFESSQDQSSKLKEAWHPNNVVVYASKEITLESQAIHFFHREVFKTTPAIGGRAPGDNRPKYVSSVWHRMLPVDNNQFSNNQYLEIVTVFHGDRRAWENNGKDQLFPFINALKERNLQQVWGNELKN
jgi:CRISPR-associated protein Cmr6